VSGVRRIGKTILAKELPDNEYFNCDLPSTRTQLEDPEFFLHNRTVPGRIVLDEIHRLDDPSSLLKIAADEFPLLRILATGSSTLDATRKFRDNLAGRKHMLLLTPVLWSECADFGIADIDRRLLHGGFPEMLLAAAPDPAFFQEWLDSLYARDIMELFGIRNRIGFMSLLRLLLHRSGGLLDVTDLSKESGLSRPTVLAHLEALETSHAIVRVAPWAGGISWIPIVDTSGDTWCWTSSASAFRTLYLAIGATKAGGR
jgi:predicted AAA+ superfamily ATPase